ncbi:MAG: hypothetical protein HQ593_04380 [Candidatus Omnitrophica bacterium]|nr:hypothetical protein [Candidatus Omnitrophota bacterium]
MSAKKRKRADAAGGGNLSKNIMLTLSSILICLLVFELGLRLTKYGKFENPIYQRDRKVFYKLSPDASHEFAGSMARTNSKGFRSPEFDEVKSADTKRILCFGDSITFGVGLPDEKTYPKILEDILNSNSPDGDKCEVINTAVGGYDMAIIIRSIKEYVPRFKPDIVILANGHNNGRLDRENHLDKLRFFRSPLGSSKICELLRNAIMRNQKRVERILPYDNYKDILREAVEICRNNDSELIFVSFPTDTQVWPHSLEEDIPTRYQEALEAERRGQKDRVLEYQTLEYSSIDFDPSKIRTDTIMPLLKSKLSSAQSLCHTDRKLHELLKTAIVYLQDGRPRSSIPVLWEAAERLPGLPMIHYYLGVAYAMLKNQEVMEREFTKAVGLSKAACVQYAVGMREVAFEKDVPLVDIIIEFEKLGRGELFIDICHHTEEGSQRTAEAIYRELKKGGLL